MKKVCLPFLLVMIACFVLEVGAWAQENTSDTFTLEEVTVTAEKRAENLQQLPSAVSALNGDDLLTQSKITTAQILEEVPNVKFRDGGGLSPLGNISIRGIQRTQDFRGVDEALPATTAVYVDGIYLGIGGNYDLNRVEILRGPQGTLYGRSATGGVVSFYTNDPKLDEFGGNVTVEFGSDALINAQGALNVPVGEKVALRAAAHYYSRDGYFDPEGGQTETKEGRIKVLFKPSDALDIVLQAAMQRSQEWAGGWTQTADRDDSSGNTYILKARYSGTPGANPPKEYSQYGINANYDFGDMTLTWIAGYHDFDQTGQGVESSSPPRDGVTQWRRTDQLWPKDYYHSEELRLASDTEGRLTWLLGVTYFHQEYTRDTTNWQTRVEGDPDVPADMPMAIDMHEWQSGEFKNYGLFTEETFEITDALRMTAGLRYDYTEFINNIERTENMNRTAAGSYLYGEYFTKSLFDDVHKWHNITYKLRFDYDLTPENMIYVTTASGFVPGFATLGPRKVAGVLEGFDLRVLDEQELISYEIGSKNQFLDNHLRVNGAAFYYDVEGYPQVYELGNGVPGPAQKVMTTTPVDVYGLDLEIEYVPTIHDKITLAAGYQYPKLKGHTGEAPLEWHLMDGTVVVMPADSAAVLKTQPGHPKLEATLGYEHSFDLANGSTIVPRAELYYTGSYYLEQMSWLMVEWGATPYDHQDAYTLCNANVSWTSPNRNFSVNLWVRNAFDKLYKAGPQRFGLMESAVPTNDIPVGLGDPRTFGVMVSAKF